MSDPKQGRIGFVIHLSKSDFIPSKIIEYLGFVINTGDMTIRLTYAKKMVVFNMCTSLCGTHLFTIRDYLPFTIYLRLYRKIELPVYAVMLHYMDGVHQVILKNVEANLALMRKNFIQMY